MTYKNGGCHHSIILTFFVVSIQFACGSATAGKIGIAERATDKPIEITADQGIEWRQKTSSYSARGNAKAVQGNVAVHAETLTAYYRKTPDQGSQIWRIDADGDVRIITPTQRAYGKKGTYNVTKGLLKLTGSVRLDTNTDRITARDSLEYWEGKNLAIARGNAVATRGDNRLRADVLTALFEKDKDGNSQVRKVDAFDNILITTPDEVIKSHRGVYDLKTGIVTLTGFVKITRGGNQLNGARAEVNLNTGVSKIFGDGTRSVRGIFTRNIRESKSGRNQKMLKGVSE